MPDFDGGHYFLTALSPVLADPVARVDGSITSPAAALREALASLPMAVVQSEPGADEDCTSPFARCHRTHFARWVVIDQPAFNGRDPGNAIVQGIRKTDLLAHQPSDRLTRAWLLLVVDFDAVADAPDHGLRDYLIGLWSLMAPELTDVYRHCHGFDEVRDGAGFAGYVTRCQVETTMSVNDYHIDPPKLPTLSLVAVGGIMLATIAGVALLAIGLARLLGLAGGWAWAGAPVALAAALWAAYRFVGRRGALPFPTAPGSDLRTILKSLRLQQRFATFAIAQQGTTPEALHAAFGAFLADERPDDVRAPAQSPGVIRS